MLRNKIILSHSPGTAGNHIAALIGNKKGKLNFTSGVWESTLSAIKNNELLCIKEKGLERWTRQINILFSKGEVVICTHQSNFKFPNNYTLIRTYWNKSLLTKYFCYRDINTTNFKKVLPIFYHEQNYFLNIILNEKIPMDVRIKKFMINHINNNHLTAGKPNLGKQWKYFCLDNILDLKLFLKDLEKLCKDLNLRFHKEKLYNMHKKWIKQNKKYMYGEKLAFTNLKDAFLFHKARKKIT